MIGLAVTREFNSTASRATRILTFIVLVSLTLSIATFGIYALNTQSITVKSGNIEVASSEISITCSLIVQDILYVNTPYEVRFTVEISTEGESMNISVRWVEIGLRMTGSGSVAIAESQSVSYLGIPDFNTTNATREGTITIIPQQSAVSSSFYCLVDFSVSNSTWSHGVVAGPSVIGNVSVWGMFQGPLLWTAVTFTCSAITGTSFLRDKKAQNR